MAEGLPLPWPFPWNYGNPSTTIAHGKLQSLSSRAHAHPLAVRPSSFAESVRATAEAARTAFGQDLPAPKGIELYLIEAVSEVALPDPTNPSKPIVTPVVIYPPELLLVLDVGLENSVGGFVGWNRPTYGYADPNFPEGDKRVLRSIVSNDPAHLIFPIVAGSIMVGCKEGTSEADIKKELGGAGLQDVSVAGTFVTASCKPFEEPSVCAHLEANIPFVKYAEPNGVVRLIDFSPGWLAKRLV